MVNSASGGVSVGVWGRNPSALSLIEPKVLIVGSSAANILTIMASFTEDYNLHF